MGGGGAAAAAAAQGAPLGGGGGRGSKAAPPAKPLASADRARAPRQLEGYDLERSEANESGYKWVVRKGSKWVARMSQGGETTHLGSFDTPEAAALAIAKRRAEAGVEKEEQQEGEEGEEEGEERCARCGGADSPEGNELLLCDGPGCDRGYHLKCLAPPLATVPEAEWFCPRCRPPPAAAAAAAAASSLGASRAHAAVPAAWSGVARPWDPAPAPAPARTPTARLVAATAGADAAALQAALLEASAAGVDDAVLAAAVRRLSALREAAAAAPPRREAARPAAPPPCHASAGGAPPPPRGLSAAAAAASMPVAAPTMPVCSSMPVFSAAPPAPTYRSLGAGPAADGGAACGRGLSAGEAGSSMPVFLDAAPLTAADADAGPLLGAPCPAPSPRCTPLHPRRVFAPVPLLPPA